MALMNILIKHLLELVSMPRRDIKLFLTSRATIATDVRELLDSCSLIEVTAPKTRNDMELYISSERTRQILEKWFNASGAGFQYIRIESVSEWNVSPVAKCLSDAKVFVCQVTVRSHQLSPQQES